MSEKTYDGAEALSAISGIDKSEIRKMWEDTKRQLALAEACELHEFEIVHERPLPSRKCRKCGWHPRGSEVHWYLKGLEHGRKHATGGGVVEEVRDDE